MSVLEAWAHCLPVLMTNECNLPDGFAEEAAFRIDLQPSALAEQLSSVLKDDGALQRAGKQGRKLASRQYSWDRIAESMNAIYADVLNSPRASSNE